MYEALTSRHAQCAQIAHTMGTPCSHCARHCVCVCRLDLSFSGRAADEAGACAEGAPSIKCVLPAILHLYSTCTSRSGQQIRYGWRARSLQSWVVWLHALMTIHIM